MIHIKRIQLAYSSCCVFYCLTFKRLEMIFNKKHVPFEVGTAFCLQKVHVQDHFNVSDNYNGYKQIRNLADMF